MILLMLPVLLVLVVGPILANRKRPARKLRAPLIHMVLVGGWLGFLLMLAGGPGSTTSVGPHVVAYFAGMLFWATVMIDVLVLGLIGMLASAKGQ
jgi:hypothetical protein